MVSPFLSLKQYAQETQHEKILRGLAVGIALTMYARLEEADALVTSLSTDKDPVLRRSGMYTLAMAYCGTGSNQAIRKLLHVAVSGGKGENKLRGKRIIRRFNERKESLFLSMWQLRLYLNRHCC